jgi:hypothetical protein
VEPDIIRLLDRHSKVINHLNQQIYPVAVVL